MTDWLDLVVDAQALRAVFGEHAPTLSGIAVAEVSVQPDGRRVAVRFDLPEFPADPPAKWVAAGHNTVQVVLTFEGTEHMALTGPITDDAADLALTKDDERVTGTLTAPSFTLSVRSQWLFVTKMSAYQRG